MNTVNDDAKSRLLPEEQPMMNEVKSGFPTNSLPSPATSTVGVAAEKRTVWWKRTVGRLVAFSLLYWAFYTTALDLSPGFFGRSASGNISQVQKAQEDFCPQTEPLNPKAHAALEHRLVSLFQDSSYKRTAYDALSGAIQVPCVNAGKRRCFARQSTDCCV